ncbi:unnamed protein product, partial [Ectocarpus fasciculatus]
SWTFPVSGIPPQRKSCCRLPIATARKIKSPSLSRQSFPPLGAFL